MHIAASPTAATCNLQSHTALPGIPQPVPCAETTLNDLCLRFPANILQVLGPDVEYIISRAQAIQQGANSSVLTAEHLQKAIGSLQGGAGAGDGALTKEDIEATMQKMLMVSYSQGF
jgi:hypothetical protein